MKKKKKVVSGKELFSVTNVLEETEKSHFVFLFFPLIFVGDRTAVSSKVNIG